MTMSGGSQVPHAAEHESPPTLFGVVYPLHRVLALFADAAAAQRAGEALGAAGFGTERVRVLPGEQLVREHEAYLRRRSGLQRLGALLAWEERAAMEEQVAAARRGHALVGVEVHAAEELERARDVLAAHGAYGMRYYGPATITELGGPPAGALDAPRAPAAPPAAAAPSALSGGPAAPPDAGAGPPPLSAADFDRLADELAQTHGRQAAALREYAAWLRAGGRAGPP